MSLYSDFSKYYDRIFPVDMDTVSYLRKQFMLAENVLDLGTGSGGYAIELAKKGLHVAAIDFDPAMIEIAKEKATHQTVKVDFRVGDMLKLEKSDAYDGIFCIGNTLVHLNTPTDLKIVLGNIYDALKSDGTFVLQIVNYDRIIDHHITSLPTIQAGDTVFVRNYELSGGKILFNTELTTENGTFKNTVPLLPIRHSELFRMMTQVGFREVRSFGGFDASYFDIDKSFMLVMKGHKL